MAEANSFIRPEALWQLLGLRAEQVVVHLGCGAGFYLIPAAKIVGSQGKVIGIAIRPDILAEADNRARRHGVDSIVSTVRANLENTPGSSLEEKIADWVLVTNILHQSDPNRVLAEAKRLVAVKGTIAVVEWNTSATPFGPPNDQRRTPDEIIEIANSIDLTLIKQMSPSPYHFGLLFSI